MMKVVITDDEIQIRKGLKMKVDWEEEGFQIVGEASNGKETFDLLNSIDVDIVITDVRMPIMDGIEFAKRANREFPHVKVVVLSGYSDFEYVRSSLVEGVKDYLLKPVAPDELIHALYRIRSEVEEEKRKKLETEKMNKLVHNQLEEMKQQYLLHLAKEELSELKGTLERLQQLQLNEFTSKDVIVQFFTIEMRTKDPQLLKELWLPFMMLCKEIAREYDNTYCFYDANYTNMLHFIHRVDCDKGQQTTLIVDRVQKHVKKYLKIETVVGIGKIVTGLKEFKSGYISALLSWSQSKLGTHSQVIDGTINQELFEFSPDIEKRLVNSIENVSIHDFKHNMKEILGETNNQSMMSFSFAASRVLFLLSSLATKYNLDTNERHQLIWNCQQSIWQLNTQHTVIDQLIKLAELVIKKIQDTRCSSNGSEIVENVRKYLNKHYANEISLTSLSEQFHINSAYLSELFKHHVGQNFSDYLIQVRMEKAKEFLFDRQLKIIDVAYLVGFSNSGYFSTVFKKHVGKTPAEFRKEITK
ncbi:response regulator transcription factor [Metabacillus halosaccharovorans]|uniref:response regulator transcription factor n=1 Tax=Metabacillus halosaccharovorans TaxID=930124 RepID=UPI0020A6DE25|nr:response regulator [Metabacillus halosaccharovorans]